LNKVAKKRKSKPTRKSSSSFGFGTLVESKDKKPVGT